MRREGDLFWLETKVGLLEKVDAYVPQASFQAQGSNSISHTC